MKNSAKYCSKKTNRIKCLYFVGFFCFGIAVVTGLVPATGISLPFCSYGGTALALQLVEMGIVLSVSRQIPAPRNG